MLHRYFGAILLISFALPITPLHLHSSTFLFHLLQYLQLHPFWHLVLIMLLLFSQNQSFVTQCVNTYGFLNTSRMWCILHCAFFLSWVARIYYKTSSFTVESWLHFLFKLYTLSWLILVTLTWVWILVQVLYNTSRSEFFNIYSLWIRSSDFWNFIREWLKIS